jgi:hypothetical protein
MATKLEIIDDIYNTAVKGIGSSDTNLSKEQIGFWVDSYRALILYRELRSKKRSMYNWYQTISCVPLTTVSVAECCADVPLDCTVKRTVDKFPKLLDVMSFTTLSNEVISITTPNAIEYRRYAPIGKHLSYAYFANDYWFLVNEPTLKFVKLRVLAEDPELIRALANCGGGVGGCNDTLDTTYPIPAYFLPELVNTILRDKFNLIQKPLDTINDGTAN